MLTHTFSHIPGIGLRTEQRLWQAGIRCWDDARSQPLPHFLAKKEAALRQGLDASRLRLDDDPGFFTARLPPSRHWRIFPHFRQRTAYLDIETSGGGPEGDHVTAISLWDGATLRSYVWGENLEQFLDDVLAYRVLVTFNGKSFDVPVLERHFRTRLPHAQIDLCHVLRGLGLRGGLKAVEKACNIFRMELDGIDGYAAVLLWRHYEKTGDRRALDTLLAYNVLDTVNLEALTVEAYNRHVAATPFADQLRLPYPWPPANPYRADPDLLAACRRGWI
ncbi:MAG: ribonuclease H-like domain-containing protein [Thermodesulfobacteriota bacterium]